MTKLSYKTQVPPVLPMMPEFTGSWTYDKEGVRVFLNSILDILEEFPRNVKDDIALIRMPVSQPSNPNEGNFYFNTDDDKIYVYNGSAWVSSAALT